MFIDVRRAAGWVDRSDLLKFLTMKGRYRMPPEDQAH
jgi:hypothetical protein